MAQLDGILALDRMERAVWQVKDRLLRATAALEQAKVPYAVVGGNAVIAWVEQRDVGAARATRDVDIAIRRSDLEAATDAMEKAGFVYQEVAGVHMFLDGSDGIPSQAVHLVFSGEKVRPQYAVPVPDVEESESFQAYQVVALEALVRMKLTSFRDKDRTHLRDMIGVGLIDESWPTMYPPELGQRLQELLDDPEG